MAYAPTDWVNNVTPLDEAHLDNIEQGIVALDTGKVDKDSVVVAAARLVASNLLAGDANPAFRILGDGTILWGPGGGTIQDVQLSRRANDGQMRLTGTPSLYIEHSLVAGQGITTFAGTAQQIDIGFVLAQPGFNFGFPGDTNLYRAGVNQLKTDGDLSAVGLLRASRGGGVNEVLVGNSGIQFGGDTSLGRIGANALRTLGSFDAVSDLFARSGGANQCWIGDVSGKAGVVLGAAQDVKLYRQSAGILRTDGTFDANALTINGVPVSTGGATDITGKVDKDSVVVAATRVIASKLLAGDAQPAFFLGGDGKIQWGTGGAAALDTYLYRTAPGQLKTDGTLRVTQGISANYGSSSQIHLDPTGKLYFGNALDTYLYRSAANVVKTDGSLYAGAAVAANIGGAGQLVLTTSHGGLPTLDFGSGDVLYRSAASFLSTNSLIQVERAAGADAFKTYVAGDAGNRFRIDSNGRFDWGAGSGYDTSLYRSAANELTTAGFLYANGGLGAKSGSLYLQSDGGKIFLGTASDVNLYRFGANYLKSDSNLLCGATVAVDHNNAGGKLYFGSGTDANIYRSAASHLKTDGFFHAGLPVVAMDGAASQVGIGNYGPTGQAAIIFGGDTYLYRSAAGVLAALFQALGNRDIVYGGPDSAGAGYRSLRVSN